MERVDVAVVGAGVVGLAVARELRERGHRVAVLERTGIGSGASGVQPGGVRQQWGTRVACRLARESIAFWREADERLKSRVPLTLRRSGYLFVARSRETLDRLAANVALQQEEGVPSQIVGAAEAAELVPGLAADQIAGGAWCAEDGYFDRPQAVVESFANGLEVRLETVETLRALRADAIVVAAGAETKALLATIGVEVPIEREDRYLFFSEPIRERLLEPLVVAPELAFAAKQLADGRVLASDLTARGDADAGRERWRATIRSATDTLLPQLTHVSYPLLVRGVYDVTPDHQPILGPVADAVEGVRDPVLDILGAERFAAGRLVPEPQLI